MYPIKKCQKIISGKAIFFFGPSTKEKSVGYLQLKPCSSLTLHNQEGGIESLIQVKGKCVMVVFNKPQGTNHLIKKGDKLTIKPKGVRHIHTNPFNQTCLTYWHFDGDIRKVIANIKKRAKIWELADYIVPGHGNIFKIDKKINILKEETKQLKKILKQSFNVYGDVRL